LTPFIAQGAQKGIDDTASSTLQFGSGHPKRSESGSKSRRQRSHSFRRPSRQAVLANALQNLVDDTTDMAQRVPNPVETHGLFFISFRADLADRGP
jgi:hypothetical protein